MPLSCKDLINISCWSTFISFFCGCLFTHRCLTYVNVHLNLNNKSTLTHYKWYWLYWIIVIITRCVSSIGRYEGKTQSMNFLYIIVIYFEYIISDCFIFYFFSVRLLSVLRGHSVFSSPPQRPMTSDFEGFSIPDFIHYIYLPFLILEKEPVFFFWMFSAKQGHYWYHFYNVFGMTRSLTGDWTRDISDKIGTKMFHI